MGRDEAGQVSSDWPEDILETGGLAKSFRAHYSGTDGEMLANLRRGKTGPHLCLRIIIQELEG